MEQKTVLTRLAIPDELNRKIMSDAALDNKNKAEIILEILEKEYAKKK